MKPDVSWWVHITFPSASSSFSFPGHRRAAAVLGRQISESIVDVAHICTNFIIVWQGILYFQSIYRQVYCFWRVMTSTDRIHQLAHTHTVHGVLTNNTNYKVWIATTVTKYTVLYNTSVLIISLVSEKVNNSRNTDWLASDLLKTLINCKQLPAVAYAPWRRSIVLRRSRWQGDYRLLILYTPSSINSPKQQQTSTYN